MRNVLASSITLISAVCGSLIANPPLDFSSLGHVAVAGQFSGISIYENTQQSAVQTSGTQDGLYVQNSDGTYTSLGQTDGVIFATCALNVSNVETIFLGGNFSRVGNVSAVNLASYTPSTNLFKALSSGVIGTVKALYCDSTHNQVYIGGSFEIGNSTNAVLWNVVNQRYMTVPFGGLDGPVNTITAGGSSVLFGGQFDSTSSQMTSTSNEPQQVNLQTAYVGNDVTTRLYR